MRRFGKSIDPAQTYTDRPGAYGIIVSEKGILLTHQSEPVPEFQLPGGGIDAGESPLQALHREVGEETGWRIAVAHRLGVYQRYTFMPDYKMFARKVCHIYLARAARCVGPPSEAGHEPFWIDGPLAVELVASEGDAYFLDAFLRAY